jgi:hypothetical protein
MYSSQFVLRIERETISCVTSDEENFCLSVGICKKTQGYTNSRQEFIFNPSSNNSLRRPDLHFDPGLIIDLSHAFLVVQCCTYSTIRSKFPVFSLRAFSFLDMTQSFIVIGRPPSINLLFHFFTIPLTSCKASSKALSALAFIQTTGTQQAKMAKQFAKVVSTRFELSL